MDSNNQRPCVVLRQGRESSLRRRHPWVFSGAIAERKGSLKAGVLVDVLAKDGTYLGTGHWGTRSIAVRVLSFEKIEDETLLLQEKLQRAVRLRTLLGLISNSTTNGFRLIHGEGDELPGLVIDIYGSTAVVQCHSAGMWRLRDALESVLLALKELHLNQIVFRLVEAQVDDEGSGNEKSEAEPGAPKLDPIEPNVQSKSKIVTFSENGLRFLVDVEAGQKTGFFLDQRMNRMRIKDYARGRHVLNAFSYTGAFSVYALAGGAESVCSVDASKPAIDMCRQNVVLNFAQAVHRCEAADCFTYLDQVSDSFDLIVLDPPAFAKHQRAIQRAVRGYETINTLAMKKIRPGGILATFSCSQLVTRELFRDSILRAAASARRSVRILEHLHQAPCHPTNVFHPEGEYLKGLILYVE